MTFRPAATLTAFVLLTLPLFPAPALACQSRFSPDEQARSGFKYAPLIVVGKVNGSANGIVDISVARILKGSASASISIKGTLSEDPRYSTSEDWRPITGRSYVIYVGGVPGAYQTQECIGNHEVPVRAIEEALASGDALPKVEISAMPARSATTTIDTKATAAINIERLAAEQTRVTPPVLNATSGAKISTTFGETVFAEENKGTNSFFGRIMQLISSLFRRN